MFFTLVARSPTPQPFTEFKNLMKTYAKAVLVAGVIIPILLHMLASESMPWWPDTVSMGIAFGAAALAVVWKTRKKANQINSQRRPIFMNDLLAVRYIHPNRPGKLSRTLQNFLKRLCIQAHGAGLVL